MVHSTPDHVASIVKVKEFVANYEQKEDADILAHRLFPEKFKFCLEPSRIKLFMEY